MTHITAIAPVLNEAGNIKELVTRLIASISTITEDFTILIVDDGSTDQTWAELRRQSKNDPRVGGLRFSRNFGQHPAISAGLAGADADWVVVMDGDLQDRPEVIPDLYTKAQEGFDCVFVERQDRPESRLYLLGQKIFYSVLRRLTGGNYDGRHGNFSIISRDVVESYNQFSETGRFYGGLVDWLGYSRGAIQAAHGERFSGNPSYDLRKRFRFAKQIILSFSTRPLEMTLNFGLLVIFLTFAAGLMVFLRALFFGYSIEGWASLMVSIYFLGGVQMVMIGVVGLYIGRISDEVKGRPGSVVREYLKPSSSTEILMAKQQKASPL
ncbi:glycosyltransferase family 2 protein [Ruegeria sp. Ofav3-42]|uniref:glycosyltransferase family 2 protein n=1 Tax=Ruegeria sp. Ofav3-42 TaxID=2917759 RepID=UPI001EF69E13|nr:glycosyltransferase family 2 protein [Ruegeria sp. Ofav3-42]MCG7522020.1 glycosyltransferase family 2 protein [Ruegeria sp. Ofav3-42]